jgi:hypothetical protein
MSSCASCVSMLVLGTAGYLQHYETLLKEIDHDPASDAPHDEPVDQYGVKRCTLAVKLLTVI